MKRLRWPVLAAAGVLVAGSGTAYAVAQDDSNGRYRTVRAAKGDVEQVLSVSGTVDAAHRADLQFGTSGTVARLTVALGDTVKAGQVVARLDSTSLRAAVTKAEASVAKALAQLKADEDAQAEAVSSAAAATSESKPKGSSSPGSTGTTPTTGPTAAALQQLKQQQAAVVQAQSATSSAIAAAKDALTAQAAACADAYQDTNGNGADSGNGSAARESSGSAGCSDSLAVVQARQADVSAAQDDLQRALDMLAETLGKAVAALAGGNDAHPRSTTSSAARADTGSSTRSSTRSSASTDESSVEGSGSVTAARLAADQAAIEKARAELVVARQQLRQAALRSTRSGRVVSLPVAAGDAVSAGDLGAVVVGGTAITIETTVPESRIAAVKVGERVRVTTPGQAGSAAGTVTAIGLVADTSSGTASYPVTVTVEDPAISLPAGSRALLGIIVATAKDVVTVPTSAVTRTGGTTSVRTWDGHTLSRKPVTVGTVGDTEVEVTHGLDVGDEVVLADLDQAITGASDSVNDRGGFTGPPGNFDRVGAGGGPVRFRSSG